MKLAPSQAIQSTPPKPIASPATRARVSVSLSQSRAISAAKSGDAELKIADMPAVIDSAA